MNWSEPVSYDRGKAMNCQSILIQGKITSEDNFHKLNTVLDFVHLTKRWVLLQKLPFLKIAER